MKATSKTNKYPVNLCFERGVTLKAEIKDLNSLDEFIIVSLSVFNRTIEELLETTQDPVLVELNGKVSVMDEDVFEALTCIIPDLSVGSRVQLARDLHEVWTAFLHKVKDVDNAVACIFHDTYFSSMLDNDTYSLFYKAADVAENKFRRFMPKAARLAFVTPVLLEGGTKYLETLSKRELDKRAEARDREVEHAKAVLKREGYVVSRKVKAKG